MSRLSLRPAHLRAAVLVLLGLLLAMPGWGAEKRSKKKKTSYTVGEMAYKKLLAAQELMSQEQFTEAREILDDLSKKRLNPHERALTLQSLGFVQSSEEQWDAAIESFEQCLAQDALPPGAQHSTQYNLAQIYMMRERYGDASKLLESWFRAAEKPGPEAYYLIATAYALDDRLDKALRPAELAVIKSKSPKEQWLQLLLTLYFEKKDYRRVSRVLELLVSRFPKKVYWMQLAAVYSELERDEQSLAVLQLVYEQGLMVEHDELMRLAQLYLYAELPYRAALVLEKGLEEEIVESNAKAWEMLANSWIQAREYERALAPLERAASLADDGDLYIRLGQIHLERQDWKKAEEALARAIANETLDDRGQAHLLMGVGRYSAGRVDAAEKSFASAKKYESSRQAATDWLAHIENDRLARAN